MIILISNRDIATTWRDTAALTFDPVIQQFITTLDISKKTQETLFRENPASMVQRENKFASLLVKEDPMHHAFCHLQMEWVKQQLSGNMLADIGDSLLGYINQSLRLARFSPTFIHTSTRYSKSASLEHWV